MAAGSPATVDRWLLLRGAIAGAAAFLLGYLLTYAWKAAEVAEALRGINAVATFLGGEAIPTWKAVGWLFYNAHFVAVTIPLPGGPAMVDLIQRSDDPALQALYVLVPVLLLVAGGLAARSGAPQATTDAALAGAAVVVGYLPLVVAGLVLSAHAVTGGADPIRPDPVTSVLLAGLVYPIAFGAIGGVVAARLR